MMDFSLNKTFDTIIIGYNSFLHLLKDNQAEECLKTTIRHMHSNSFLYIDIYKPSPLHSCRPKNKRLDVIEYYDSQIKQEVLIQETNDYNPFPYLSSMEQIIKSKNPELIIFGHTYETRDWVPRLSARLDQPFLSDCISHKIENGELIFTRSLYQNKVNQPLYISI